MLAPFRLANLLSYPANRNPGFDASHPFVARPVTFSAIATQTGNIISVTSPVGDYGTVIPGTGPPVARLDPIIGASVFYPLLGGTGTITIPGLTNAPDTATIAAIIRPSQTSSGTIFHNTTVGNTGVQLSIALNKLVFFAPGNKGSAQSSFNITAGVPWFVVASWNGNIVNFAATRLDTGQSAYSSTVPFVGKHRTGNGTYSIGNSDARNDEFNGNIASIAYTSATLTASQLFAIAADPWTFWFPPFVEQVIGFSRSPQHAPAAATASLNGTGSLTVNAFVAKAGSARFNGAGSLSVSTIQTMQDAATFAGTGSLSVNAFVFKSASATFAGAGSLSITTIQNAFISAVFNGTGSLSVNPKSAYQGSVVFAGSGNLSAFALVPSNNRATFNGTGSLSIATTVARAAFVQFNGAGSFRISSVKTAFIGFLLTGSGGLSVTPAVSTNIAATFSGTGSLTANTLAPVRAIAVQFNGTGSLSIVAIIPAPPNSVEFDGDGRLCIDAYTRKGPPGVKSNRVIRGPGPVTNIALRGGTSGPIETVCLPCPPAGSSSTPIAITPVVVGYDGTPLLGYDGSSIVADS